MKKTIKRIMTVTLMTLAFAASAETFKVNVFAADTQRKNMIQFGFISMQTDIPIKIIDGRAMVPLRDCSNLLGATVTWDKDTRTASSELGDIKIDFIIGSKTYFVNGEEKTMDAQAFIDNGSTYIPLRYVAEGLGYKIDFKQTDKYNIYIISEAK